MAVTKASTNFNLTPFKAIDKRYPIYKWTVSDSILGDVSAGTGTVSFTWPNSVQDMLVSVEGWHTVVTGAVADIKALLQVNTREQGLNNIATQQLVFSKTCLLVGTLAEQGEDFQNAPIFRPSLTGFSVEQNVTNPTAAGSLFAYVWGFIWNATSLLEQRGPLKPWQN